ncbi:hypothetical protein HYU45_03700 [Candidatus Daviesbacteria bacterium]|nr:hypothetical protein [Candidatus Daviesbacteria bacterium]
MENEPSVIRPNKINWPDHVTPQHLLRMVELCNLKNTRVVVADEIETEGLVLRGAIEQRFGSQDYQLPMVNAYARIGQEIRHADDGLRVWQRELGRGNFIPINTTRQRYLRLLLNDPKGFEFLKRSILEKSDNGELSLSEIEGFAAGARRYCQFYEVLIAAGVKPKELEERRFYPQIAGGARPLLHRREDIPKEGEYTVVEEIVKDGILVDERGYYHVFWGKSHYYFQDFQAVLYNHDRVIENLQGTLITVQNDVHRVLEIEGEIPQVIRFAHRLSFISAGLRNVSLHSPQTRRQLLGELSQLKDEIGQVRNELKKQGRDKILAALASAKPEAARQQVQQSARDFLERASDAAAKLEGAVQREEILLRKRNRWEERIEDSFRILGNYLWQLEERKHPTPRWLNSLSLQTAAGPKNILADLQGIPGQPYKGRMEQPEIRRLAEIPDVIARNDFLSAKRILNEAILMLSRVVKEKAERERAAENTS